MNSRSMKSRAVFGFGKRNINDQMHTLMRLRLGRLHGNEIFILKLHIASHSI